MFANKMKPKSFTSTTIHAGHTIDYVKWGLIFLFMIFTILVRLNVSFIPIKALMFLPMIVFAWIHGTQRYGFKNMMVWFVITWLVSHGFEALSVRTGFPFGHYHYERMPGPRVLDVPLIIMAVYFALGYTSWTIAQMVSGNFEKKAVGIYKFIVPLTAAFVMTMFDLTSDPQAATISSDWVWENGGAYYGVPLSNYFGWVFVVYVFMQIFMIFISHKNKDVRRNSVITKRTYWLEASIIYLIMGLGVVLEGIVRTEHADLYSSMALVSVFTMVFTAGVSMLNLKHIHPHGYAKAINRLPSSGRHDQGPEE